MEGTLTITGPISVLGKYLALAEEFQDSLSAEMEAGSWTVERARILLRFLGPRQRTLFELLDEGDGFASGERLREEFGEKLNGLTGPILKHMDSLARRGLLPAGLERPVHSLYGRSRVGWADGLQMPAELVPVFREALNPSPSLLSCETSPSSGPPIPIHGIQP